MRSSFNRFSCSWYLVLFLNNLQDWRLQALGIGRGSQPLQDGFNDLLPVQARQNVMRGQSTGNASGERCARPPGPAGTIGNLRVVIVQVERRVVLIQIEAMYGVGLRELFAVVARFFASIRGNAAAPMVHIGLVG